MRPPHLHSGEGTDHKCYTNKEKHSDQGKYRAENKELCDSGGWDGGVS